MTTTKTIPGPRITYYDKDMRVMADLTTCEAIWRADTGDIVCDMCGAPADMIGTGHQDFECPNCQPPPPFFKYDACWEIWFSTLAQDIADGYVLQCRDCNECFETIDEFSVWRPV